MPPTRILLLLLLLLLAVVGFYGGLALRGGTVQPLRIVHGPQTWTSLRAGDLVIVESPNKTILMPGDVVLIDHYASQKPALRRVVGTRTTDAGLSLLTRDQTSELFPVPGSAVQAKVVGRIPMAGYVLVWLGRLVPPVGVAALAIFAMFRLAGPNSISRLLVYEG